MTLFRAPSSLPDRSEQSSYERQRRRMEMARLRNPRCGLCDGLIETGAATAMVDDERCHAECAEDQ